MNSPTPTKLKISSVVLSAGLGGRTPKQIEEARLHFIKIFNETILQKPVTTVCKKANAKFKIRVNIPMGFKVTLRKSKIYAILKLLKATVPDFLNTLHWDKNTYSVGVRDHRTLKLERYNYKAPEYGFMVQIRMEPLGSRLKYRRISPRKLKTIFNSECALDLVKSSC